MSGFAGLALEDRRKDSSRVLAESEAVPLMLGALCDAAVVADTPVGAVLLHCDRASAHDAKRRAPAILGSVRHLRILFDGRIDNRRDLIAALAPGLRFASALSDGDILRLAYAKWGEDAPARLHGPFAFAIYDEIAATLFCARDRFGQKQFVYGRNVDGFVFATHTAALLAWHGMSRSVDLDVLAHYLSFGFALADKSLLPDAVNLHPGHWLLLDRHGEIRTRRYWRLAPVDQAMARGSRADLEHEFRQRLQDAVSRNILAAKRVGLLHGGDLASAILAHILTKDGPSSPETFAVRFGGQCDLGLKETPPPGGRHHELVIDERDISAGLAPLTLASGVPLTGLSTFAWEAVARRASPHTGTIFAATAGDEIALAHLRHRQFSASLAEWRAAGSALPSAPFARDLYHHVAGLMSEEERAALVGPGMAHTLIFSPVDELGVSLETAGDDEAMDLAARIDVANLPARSFVGANAAFTANEAGLILPFVDHEFADWCASLPQHLRSAGRYRGVDHPGLLQTSFPEVEAPRRVQANRDEGETLDAWLANGLSEFMGDTFASTAFRSRGLFSIGAIEGMLDSHLGAKRQHGHCLWSLLCIEAWFANVVDAPLPAPKQTRAAMRPVLADAIPEMA